MRLQEIVRMACRDNYCPTVFRAENGDYVVQGYRVERSELDPVPPIAPDEDLVRIPSSLIDALLASSSSPLAR